MITRGHAAGDLKINRLVDSPVIRRQARKNIVPLPGGMWVAQLYGSQACLQARKVMRQPKHPAAEDRDDFVDTVAKNKTAIENRNLRLVWRDEFSIEVNE